MLKLYFNIIKNYFCYKLGLNINHHGEDEYHKQLESDSRIITHFSFDMTDDEWEEYKKIKKKSMNNHYLSYFNERLNNGTFSEYVNDDNKWLLSRNIAFSGINNKDKSITGIFNHHYCGGGFFLKRLSNITDGEHPRLPSLPPTPFIQDYYLLKFLLKRPDIPTNKCFSIVNHIDNMKRLTFTMDRKDKPENISTRIWILKTCLDYIRLVLPEKRTLKVMIPVPFRDESNIYNNIGVSFLDYPPNGLSFDELSSILISKQYETVATNYLLKIYTNSSLGKNTRTNVDIVFTMGYSSGCKAKVKKSFVTFNKVSDYGVYFNVLGIGDIIRGTITLSTNDISYDDLLTDIPDSEPLVLKNI